MADLTSVSTIVGLNQENTRPFSYHAYEVTVPAASLVAGTHDIVLGDFKDGTKALQVGYQTQVATDPGTSAVVDIERKFINPTTGAEVSFDNFVIGSDATAVVATVTTTNSSLPVFTNGSGNIARFNAEITVVGTTPTIDLVFLAYFVGGRLEY